MRARRPAGLICPLTTPPTPTSRSISTSCMRKPGSRTASFRPRGRRRDGDEDGEIDHRAVAGTGGMVLGADPCTHSRSCDPAEIEPLDDVVASQFVDRTGRDDDLAMDDDVASIGDPDRLIEVLLGHQHGQADMPAEFAELSEG